MRSQVNGSAAKRGLQAAAAFTVGLAIATGAAAQVLPAASYNVTSYPNGPNGSNPLIVNASGSVSTSTNNIDGVASGAATATSQYVSADAMAAGNNEGIGSASETYYFSVIGPQSVDVHLLISGGGYLYSTGGDGSVSAYENINNITNYGRTCIGGSSACGYFSYDQSVYITSNTVAYLSLSIYALVQNGSNGGWIDPMITIDPNFAGADQFHLAFSGGITNGGSTVDTGGVPEPASWALMITGLGVAGAGLRRRRRAAPLAA